MQELNKYQTPLSDELKKALPKEVWEELLEFVATVPLIQTLIDKDRDYVKDRPFMKEFIGKDEEGKDIYIKDSRGRREIDLVNPHILENMDFFRQRALYFQKHGRYTSIIPNPNRNSAYAKFWKEELKRWKHGIVRETDGEWIPGGLYFYWNYSPILLNVVTKKTTNVKKKADRVRRFPFPWLGDYLFFHYLEEVQDKGKHAKLLKSRGVGYSYKMGSLSPRNMYTRPGLPNFHLASDKTFLSGEKGIFGKVVDTLDWIAENTPLPKIRLISKLSGMEIQLGFLDEYGVKQGLKSSVFGISLKDNPDKARGIRGPLIHYEEDGLFPNLEKAWGVNREAVESGNVVHGTMIAGGTGGVEGGSFAGSEKLFYNGDAYNILMLQNVFDKNPGEGARCGFFWAAYMNRSDCYDLATGEPDVIKALVEILEERYVVKYGSSDPQAITQKKAETPIVPQEAIMRTTGTIFPVSDIKEYLEEISVRRDAFVAEHLVGNLTIASNGEIKWSPDSNITPLRSYSKPGINRAGALEIFEVPKKGKDGTAMRGRYIAGIDPIDDDTGASLYSILVMDTFTDRLVAEYTGRPKLAKQAYEITLRLLKYYNAVANYESNFKGLFSYFSNRNHLYLLVDTPQILKDMELVKADNAYGNKAKGTRANAAVNAWGRKLQADWMLEKIEGDEDKIKLHTIRSIPYLEEAMAWNVDGNFDRISAGGMLMILREEYYKRIIANKDSDADNYISLSTDPYFERNYRPTSIPKNKISYIGDDIYDNKVGDSLEI